VVLFILSKFFFFFKQKKKIFFFFFFEKHQQEICCACINRVEAKYNRTFTEKQKKITTLTKSHNHHRNTAGEINPWLPLSRHHNNERRKTPLAGYHCRSTPGHWQARAGASTPVLQHQ